MKNWKELLAQWETLSLRDKRLAAGGSAAVIFFIIYSLIWAPVANHANALRTQIEQNKKLLVWMQSANTKIQFLEKQLQPAPASTSKSLLSLIQNEINQTAFAKNLTGLRQVDNNSVQLNLKNVAFDNVMTWVIQLWQKQGLQVTRMSAAPAGETGIVTMEIVLKG